MGKEQELIQAVKNGDMSSAQKLLTKIKASKNKALGNSVSSVANGSAFRIQQCEGKPWLDELQLQQHSQSSTPSWMEESFSILSTTLSTHFQSSRAVYPPQAVLQQLASFNNKTTTH